MHHFKRSITVTAVLLGLAGWCGYAHGGAAGLAQAQWIAAVLGVLASIMLLSVEYDIAEWFTGLSGVAFIVVSLWSSIRYKRREERDAAARQTLA